MRARVTLASYIYDTLYLLKDTKLGIGGMLLLQEEDFESVEEDDGDDIPACLIVGGDEVIMHASRSC